MWPWLRFPGTPGVVTEANPAPKPQRTNYGFMPAIPFEVVAE